MDIAGERYGGVTSIGTAPTFGGTELTIEAHLFTDWQDFYAKAARLHFLEKLRDQRKFDGPDALIAQVREDVERARALLARTPT
jgi:riboflavin kinase/FMN adenylyltransferase